jgi:hypothetical protein
VSRPPGQGGAGARAATCAHLAIGPGAAFPGPRAITGTAAQPRPSQAGLAVAAGESRRRTGRRHRPGTTPAGGGYHGARGGTVPARHRAAPGNCGDSGSRASRGRAAWDRPRTAARPQAFGLAPGDGG